MLGQRKAVPRWRSVPEKRLETLASQPSLLCGSCMRTICRTSWRASQFMNCREVREGGNMVGGVERSQRVLSTLSSLLSWISNRCRRSIPSRPLVLTENPACISYQTRLPTPLSSTPPENPMLSLSSVSALHRGVLWPLVWNSLDSLAAASSLWKFAMNGWRDS
jgi:hypothetical protein